MNAMLKLKGLRKTFNPGTINEVRSLQGVDLTIEEGSFVVVLGTNGSGKSTLLNAVSGSFILDEGSIELAGVDVTHWPEHRRARICPSRKISRSPFNGESDAALAGRSPAN
jgi:putative ABC transport system ATP-binding protein